MKVRVLGCSGGIGGHNLRTTSMLVDQDVLIDAGTGVGDLPLEALAAIDHVFVTHSHLDHIAALPLMIDSVADLRKQPVTVHACQATLTILKQHIFNWAIWPDFSEIKVRRRPLMQYRAIEVGQTLSIGGRAFTALPARHTVPAIGFHLDSGEGSLVFTGDTAGSDELWPIVNAIGNLRYLIIETAFSDRERSLAEVSKHLCPSLLVAELAKLERVPEIYISHLKPGQIEQIMGEITQCAARFNPKMLHNDQLFEF